MEMMVKDGRLWWARGREEESHCIACLRLRARTISPNESDTESNDTSDTSDIDLTIPERASVNVSYVDGKPGLLINTRCTKNWTPIAARTRAKTTNCS